MKLENIVPWPSEQDPDVQVIWALWLVSLVGFDGMSTENVKCWRK